MLNSFAYLLFRHSEHSEESRVSVQKTGFFALIKHQSQNDGGYKLTDIK